MAQEGEQAMTDAGVKHFAFRGRDGLLLPDKLFREKYAMRFRVMRDDAGDPLIPCWKRTARFGPGDVRPHVYQWGSDGEVLAYIGLGNRKLGALLKKHPGVFWGCWQGDGEFEAKFPADRLNEVARSLGCRFKRRVSEDGKRRLMEAGISTRFERKTA